MMDRPKLIPAGRWRVLGTFGTDLLDRVAPRTRPRGATYFTTRRHLLEHAALLTGPRGATYWTTRRHLLEHAAPLTRTCGATY